jgi:hypothetical protein
MNRYLLCLMPLVIACAGLRYDRGASTFEAAQAPVSMFKTETEADRVSIAVGVRAGSAHDPVGQEGLAWLTAQALRHGGTQSRSPEAVDAALAAMDATVTVMVDKELVGFYGSAPQSHAAELAVLFGEMFASPQPRAEAVETLKAQGVAWLQTGLATSDARLGAAAFEQWVFQGHPYGHPAVGRASTLQHLTTADIQRFLDVRYVRPAMAFGVTDDVSTAVSTGLQEALSQRPTRLYRDVTPRPVSPVKAHGLLTLMQAGAAGWIQVGLPVAVHPGDADWPALVLASVAMNSPSQTVTPFWAGTPGQGRLGQVLGWGAEVESTQPQQAVLSSALAQARVWAEEGLSPEAVSEASARIEAQLKRADAATRLAWTIEGKLMGWADPSATLTEALGGLSVAEVNAAMAVHLNPDALRMVLVSREAGPGVVADLAIAAPRSVDARGLFR